MPKIVVVGAGVIGLTTALCLKENTASEVIIIAKHVPGDFSPEYTSPWAGAHFRPFPSKDQKMWEESRLTRITQNRFRRMAVEEPESTIRFVEGIEYLEDPDDHYKLVGKGYSEEMKYFKSLPKTELPEGVNIGFSYETWVLDSPRYLDYLARKLRFKYQVKFITKELDSLKEVNELVPNAVIVNCSGTGLQYHGGHDPDVYLIRGQTLLVNAPTDFNKTVTHQSASGLWTFCIPRPVFGGFILGGTKQLDDDLTTPRQQDTEELIERGAKLFPQLMKIDSNGKRFFDVVKVNVGFRPARHGGLNLSVERYQDNYVVNAYGAGGSGYELSYGVAEKTVESVKFILREFKI